MKSLTKVLALFLAVLLLLSACAAEPVVSDTDTAESETEPVSAQPDSTQSTGKPAESESVTVSTDEASSAEPSSSEEVPVSTEKIEPAIVNLGGYAVSSSTKEATAAGMQILKKGGNAIDAAVAVALALGVTEPYSSGLGGSGVMVVYDPAADAAYSLDYYACAGAATANTDFVGVPGMLAGMQEALDRWGTMSMSDVIKPAIKLADKGFPATALFARRLDYSAKLRQNPAFRSVRTGDTVVQKELAETLKLIRDKGISAFYNGKIAEDIAAACSLTTVDLASYHVYSYDALQSKFNGYRIFTTTAPTSGVVTSQMLTTAAMKKIANPRKSPDKYLRTMKLATQLGYKTRRNKLVDPRFYDFNGKNLVSRSYVKKQIEKLLEADTTLFIQPDPEKYCTTQFAVIDQNGMLACVTNTLSDNWGGYIYVDGFYLNNTLSNFSKSGKNAYEPMKRPRTHFSPVIVVGDDHYCLAIGSPGGDNIPKIVSQVLIDILKFGVDPQTAVDRGRYYFDDDGLLCLEAATNAEPRIEQSKISQRYYFSSSHVIFGCTAVVGYDPEKGIFAVSDQRRDGSDAQIETIE